MGARLLPRNLPELFSYSLVLEREATKRFAELERYLRNVGAPELADEFEKIGREENEQYQVIALGTSGRDLPEVAPWELSWHLGIASLELRPAPRSPREALELALAFERGTQAFYDDVARHARADAVRAFAAEMANDERRHVSALEALLQREIGAAEFDADDAGDGAAA